MDAVWCGFRCPWAGFPHVALCPLPGRMQFWSSLVLICKGQSLLTNQMAVKKIRKICVLLFIMPHTACISLVALGKVSGSRLGAVLVLLRPCSLRRNIVATAAFKAFWLTAGHVYTSLEAGRMFQLYSIYGGLTTWWVVVHGGCGLSGCGLVDLGRYNFFTSWRNPSVHFRLVPSALIVARTTGLSTSSYTCRE